jgi:ferrous iron transport protein B
LGAILVFVPQIFILFIGIHLLESSGYLARAATVIDRLFSFVGLGGRSFVPLLSGFSCAVPALIAARNIPSERDRKITQFIIPLMTCSARLPVYTLLLGFLFKEQAAWKAGVSLAALYFSALLLGGLVAAFLNKILAKNLVQGTLMLELPLYRRPRLQVILRQTITRTMSYVQKAGPVILVIALILWFGTRFPNYNMEDKSERLESSYLASVGKQIEPLFEPMGVDWRIGVGLISAFAAREVFVSTLAIMFKVSNDDEETQVDGLMNIMGSAKNQSGQLIFTTGSVVGLLIFFVIALQCMSTYAVALKETGSQKFAIVQLLAFNILAYLLAVGAYQAISFL